VFADACGRCWNTGGRQHSLVKKFPVNGTPKWDYLTVDEANRRLYLSHEAEVAVFDVDSGASSGAIANAPGVHGIAIAPKSGRGFYEQWTSFDRHNLRFEIAGSHLPGSGR
jgi:hypothetical protein